MIIGSPFAASPLLAAEPQSACPPDMAVPPEYLHGRWSLQWWEWSSQADKEPPSIKGTVILFQHPEYAHSVRGQLERQDATGQTTTAVLAGDLIDGLFKLDESADGETMTGVWEGTPVPGSCARSLMGTRWQAAESGDADDSDDAPRYQFRLDKIEPPR
ncbi:hypothetical protein [Hydrogenophaga sp. 5NK40-0174]|uniref:hypothetical protein n=1 Tax=Hydrogenophaga sp. 5NK40-0174 TaxID=3127649 RepID=UPI00334034C6